MISSGTKEYLIECFNEASLNARKFNEINPNGYSTAWYLGQALGLKQALIMLGVEVGDVISISEDEELHGNSFNDTLTTPEVPNG